MSADFDQECKPNIISVKPEVITSSCIDNNAETIRGNNNSSGASTNPARNLEDIEVDIVTCTKNNEVKSAELEDPNATECSSSFGDTDSDTEKHSGFSEAEVESQFYGDSDLASPYDSFNSIFQARKKKLTNHWRSFIRPLMWRCKWTELKIKETRIHTLKYDRELEACEQRKPSGTCSDKLEGFCSRTSPFSNQHCRRKAKKRRKRKRVEDITDTASYMSLHNLFSYLENKKPSPDGTTMIDDFGKSGANTDQHAHNDNFDIDDDQLLHELGDVLGENSLEQVLWKIEIVHSRVQKLKNQLDSVMSKHAAKFSSSENLSLLAPGDAQTSSAPSPTFSTGNGETASAGAMYTAAQLMSQFDIGDLVVPEIAMSNFGEDIHVPDIIESTVGLLSAADVTIHHQEPKIGHLHEDILDNVLLHNEEADVDIKPFVGTSSQPVEKHHEPEKGEEGESTNRNPTAEPDPLKNPIVVQENPSLSSCLASDLQIPRNKRKRAERKAGPVGWSKKGSGEPDSQ